MPNKNNRIKCYDNGGASIDRYTVCYMDQPDGGELVACVCMNCTPFHPQGFGQHSMALVGKHLSKRIKFTDLPEECKKLVRRDLWCEPKDLK